MDLNHFAKALKEYLEFYEKESAIFEKKIIDRQNQLVVLLSSEIPKANGPQSSDPVLTEAAKIYQDVVTMSREDHAKLMEQLNTIAQAHPEISKPIEPR